MAIVQTSQQRTYLQTDEYLEDISEFVSESEPLHTCTIRSLRHHNRLHLRREIVSYDLTYLLGGLFMDIGNKFLHVREAFDRGDTVRIMQVVEQCKHFIVGDYAFPAIEPQSDEDFYQFTITPESTGEGKFHGSLLDFVADPSSKSVDDVALGGYGLIMIQDVGTLTSIELKYVSSGAAYRLTVSDPEEGIHVGQLLTNGGASVPRTRPAGLMTLTPQPSNAAYSARIGYGQKFI